MIFYLLTCVKWLQSTPWQGYLNLWLQQKYFTLKIKFHLFVYTGWLEKRAKIQTVLTLLLCIRVYVHTTDCINNEWMQLFLKLWVCLLVKIMRYFCIGFICSSGGCCFVQTVLYVTMTTPFPQSYYYETKQCSKDCVKRTWLPILKSVCEPPCVVSTAQYLIVCLGWRGMPLYKLVFCHSLIFPRC